MSNFSEPLIESGAGDVLRVAGALDSYAATRLRDELRRALEGQGSLTVDLSAVETCDFTAIQLLCSARLSAAAAGKPFLAAPLSGGVRQAAEALGVPLADLGAAETG